MATGMARLDMIEVAATVYDKLLEGESDTDIMISLRIDVKTLAEVKKFIFNDRAEKHRTATREQTFVEYETRQRVIIRTIDRYVAKMDDMKMLGAVVGALRLRSDIEERIITRGQEFGLFKKTPDRKELVAGVVVADMSTAELAKAITKHHKMLEDTLKKYGESDFLALPAGPIHYGKPAFDVDAEVLEEDDEAMLSAAVKPKSERKKRSGSRSGKHTGYRERRAEAE